MYANRWVATSTRHNCPSVDTNSPEMVERKVKALLNKLTLGRFDTVSDQIIAWANKSKDGRTLIQVIKLIFETATDEEMFSKMHARLCRKMMEQISPKVQDSGVKNAVGKPYAGGQLFLKYLFNRCQEGFERGWVAKEATTIIATSKLTEDQAAKELREKTKGGDGSELYSDKYYAAAKAKRRGLGLIRFIGELFKLQMLTERIIHGCIKKLLGNVEIPGEEEIESLCMLLTIVGGLIDTQKARAHLDMYFSRMKELMRNKNVNARMMFMLQDVIELRERRWVPRNAVGAPRTIAQIHETAVKETKLTQGKDIYMRQNANMSRGVSYCDGNCDAAEPPHPDGRPIASSSAPTRQLPKAGELSQFGKISKVQHQSPPPRHLQSPAPSPAGPPMSPRNPPFPQQQVPGTPTQPHAIPLILHPPHLSTLQPSPSVTSTSTPATANLSTLTNANTNVFVPAKVSVKNRSGQEVPFDIVKRVPPAAIPPVPSPPATVQKIIKRPIWTESEEQRAKRLAEERAARRQIEEQVHPKEEERKEKEEADHAEKERKDAEECAALGERQHREAEKKAEKEHAEQERFRKLQEEEGARAKEKAERQRKDKEETRTPTETSQNANISPNNSDPVSILPETGEIGEVVSQLTTAATEEPASPDESLAASRLSSSSPPAPHIPAELSIKPLEKELSCIETTPPPSPKHPRKRPSPQTTTNANIALPLPSALATARHIEDINRITYPLGIKRPKPKLNVNTQKGKFRYDREFLLQFMNICKEKPDSLPPLDDIGLKPRDTSHMISRGGLGRNRSSNSPSMPSNTQSSSIGLGFLPGSMGKTPGSGFQMSQFSTSASKISSEERFLAATAGRPVSVTDDPLDSRPLAMVRTILQSGTGRKRTRTKRGANGSNRASVANNAGPVASSPTISPPIEPVVPLQMSANRWVATSMSSNGPGVDSDSPEVVERKVKALLNKLTIERFDSISDQIIACANKSEGEKDGRTLIQVIKLVFDTAVDEEMFSEMYARLCHKMMKKTSPKVQDDGIKNAEGKPFAGSQLFRKYLLSRCQEDFKCGWAAKEKTTVAATSKVIEDQAVKEVNEQTNGRDEYELYLDEYYAVAKAKRRGLGLTRFIGELFKAQMLTERIVHECVKMLLGNAEYPEDESEETERLCKLLTTAGKLLDTQKARAHLDAYFSRMRELTKNKNFNARIMFILQDVFELRERRWVPRKVVAAPMTIAQVHEAATKTTKLKQEKDSCMRQNASISHGVSRRGGSCDGAGPSLPGGWPSTPAVSQSDSKAEAAGKTGSHIPVITSEARIKTKIEEDTDEFFSIRRLEEAESYFSSLPPEHRHWLVGALVTKSIEMKEPDVILVCDLFVLVREKELCNPTVFEKGFNVLAESLDDLSIDIPKAWSYFATLLRGSGLDQDEKRLKRMAEKTMDPNKLNRLL